MTRDELIEKLNGFEWTDVEFKEAARDVPKDAWKTVSAFCNTAGGYLIFGVRDKNGLHDIVGVINVDKVQSDFLSTIRSGQKLNRVIDVTESFVKDGNNTLLVFHIPEARRQDKPVYLHGDIKQTFIRRGAGDEQCRGEEIEAFMRDACEERYDCVAVDVDVESFFDVESLKWYRVVYNDTHPGNETITLSDVEFMHHWGLIVEQDGKLIPTRAAILLFGTGPTVRQLLPRAVVDCQWIASKWDETLSDDRWFDRVLVEDNLIRAWRSLVRKFMDVAEHPFSVDPSTLRREESPPDYLAFRESVINLLLHQDYADHNRKATVHFYRDRVVLENPGDSFADPDELLEPGAKPLRNPRIVAALRRIGLSEEAGTGLRAIFRSWGNLGHVPPVIRNDKSRKRFALHLVREALVSDEQRLFETRLGVRLSDTEARAFAFACRNGELRLRDVKALTGLSAADAQAVINRLLTQAIVTEAVSGNRMHVVLAEHLRYQLAALGTSGHLATEQQPWPTGNLVSDQPLQLQGNVGSDQPSLSLSEPQRRIMRLCSVYRTISDLMEKIGVSHRSFFKKTHLDPLLREGILQMRFPEQANHPNQAYVLTAAGVAMHERSAVKNPKKGNN